MLKAQRDRKSDPETVKRNIEICDLRQSNPKLWSQRALAKKFDVSRQYIKKVLDEESHWRKLGRQPTT